MSIGFIPGDAPIVAPRLWYKLSGADQSAAHVKLPVADVAALFSEPAYSGYVSVKAKGEALVCATDFADVPQMHEAIRGYAADVLRKGIAPLVQSHLGVREQSFNAAIARIDAAGNASFTAFHALEPARFQPAVDAARDILGLAEALEAKGHVPAEVIAGVRAAYAKAEACVVATADKLKAAAAKVTNGFDARGVEVSAYPMKQRDAIIAQLESAKNRFKICRDKELTLEISAEKVFDHYQGYGEVHIGESAADPHMTTVTSIATLRAWCDRWIGKVD